MAMAIFWPLIAYYKQINKEANWRICSYIISEVAISKARLQDFWKLFRNEEFFRKGARSCEGKERKLAREAQIFFAQASNDILTPLLGSVKNDLRI